MVFGHTQVSTFLASELRRRIESNPKYSSNAFARDLKVSPAYLSLLISNSTILSPEESEKVFKEAMKDTDLNVRKAATLALSKTGSKTPVHTESSNSEISLPSGSGE